MRFTIKNTFLTLMLLGISIFCKAQLVPVTILEFADSIPSDSMTAYTSSFAHGDIIYYEAYDPDADVTQVYGYSSKTNTYAALHQIPRKGDYTSFYAQGGKVYYGHNGNTPFSFKVAEFDGLTKTNTIKPTFDLTRTHPQFVGNRRHMFFYGRNQTGYGVFSLNSKSGLIKLVRQKGTGSLDIIGTMQDSVIIKEGSDLLIGSTFNNMSSHTGNVHYNTISNDKETFFRGTSNDIYYLKKGTNQLAVLGVLPTKEYFQSFERNGEHLILKAWNYSTRSFTYYMLESSAGDLVRLAKLDGNELLNQKLHPLGKDQMVAFMKGGSIITYDLKKLDSIKIEPTDTLVSNLSSRYTPVNDDARGRLYYFVHNGVTNEYFLCALSNKGKDAEIVSKSFELFTSFRYLEQPLLLVNKEIHFFAAKEGGVGLYAFTENTYQLKFNCFNDTDADGVKDPGEGTINDLDLDISGLLINLQSNIDGVIESSLKMGDYTIQPQSPDGWKLTTAAKIDLLEKNYSSSASVTFDVGITPKKSQYDIDGIVSSIPIRCGFNVWIRPKLINSGTRTFSGECRISIDTLVKLDSTAFDDQPDSIIGNEYVWLYDNVEATHFKAQRIRFKAPGTQFRGTVLKFVTTYRGYGDSNEVIELVDTFKPEVNCSYDPNDKTVWPNREDLGNQTLHDEKLTYRIRFQNTGSDTAFNVVVEDTLSQHLDLTTFKLMDYSHKVETQFYDDGLVKFFFNDILLPDSNVNEPESHGFITYTVKAKEGLDEWTEIKNTAHIYFDFNPAIVTNTTSNNMVTEIKYENVSKPRADNSIIVFPNPAHNQLNLVMDNEGTVAITVMSSNGVRVLQDISVNNGRLDVSSLNPGVYFISIVQNEQVHRASFVKR